jgi:cytochrome c oxidase cbb3-type subunit 4
MDINDVRGLATILCMIGFLGVAFWAYAPTRKSSFDEAARLPFADEDTPDDDGGDARE